MGARGGSFLKAVSAWLKAAAIYSFFCLLKATWRLREQPFPPEITARLSEGKPVVFAHFHEDEWSMLVFFARRRMSIMVSLSEDGGVMARFLGWLGYEIVRGSSSKGAVSALLQLIRNVRVSESKTTSLAVDGPRGPRGRAKKGVFKLAESLDAPIICGGAAASHSITFKKSWSKAWVPRPFSRVCMGYSTVMSVEEIKRGVDRDDYATLSLALEERIKDAKSMAREMLGSATKSSLK